ncbi:MAG: flagellar hook-associated protein 3 [Pseudobutyrivibrio sp.]|nr:flagellar hook-associated protein 3 [Pseudobutyrivibrio sp.]
MRVTNKMIMNNAASNINTTKEVVNKRNKQMTSQKQIDKPSDDPVIAVRSLRLSTTLSQVTQYYSKNIPDASQWLDVTETALINMRDIVKDCREATVSGSTDTNNSQDDRNTILTQLQALQKQLYAEGNSDYANRTVFTGYRTDSTLTFTEDEGKTKYRIDQSFSIVESMEERRYYSGSVDVPTTEAEVLAPSLETTDPSYEEISDIIQTNYYRVRFGYDNIGTINSINIPGVCEDYTFNSTDDVYNDNVVITSVVGAQTYTIKVYDNATSWANDTDTTVKGDVPTESTATSVAGLKTVADNSVVIIKETGEIIFGNTVAADLKTADATIDIQYDKTGFNNGELKPEYYYNCTKLIDKDGAELSKNNVYTKFDDNGDVINFDIQYTISANQTITINTEASEVFDSSLYRDLTEMIDAVKNAMNAYDKVSTIENMMSETQYASTEDQEMLALWKDAAQKEFDYYSDNMQKLFNTELGKMDEYYATISLAITDLGCKQDSLSLTKTRVGDQQETVQELQSKNDDIDLSQIIIEYTAAYTAYQASLTAAGKLGESTLLNYI